MPRAWSTNAQHGFSVVEVLLAAAVFATIVTAVMGAIIYGRASTDNAGDRNRANLLAEEGVEAVRNIRDAGYTNLVDGTYGLALSGGVWTLSGGSDTNGMFTRQVTVASNGSNRKIITSTVSWPQGSTTSQTQVSTQLANWAAAITKLWANAYQQSNLDVTGTVAGFKIATAGNYAYLVRNASTANFYVINITNPASPTVVASLNLAASPTNIEVSGNYAYVTTSSDTAELQIVNVTTPTAPSLTGTYNATGTGDGRGIDVVGTTVYLSRAANGGSDEFVIVNAATPSAPTRVGGYGSNVTMYEVYVTGTTAYVATSSDTQEVLVINMVVPGLLTLGTSVNLTGTTDATTIDGFGTRIVVGQGTTLHLLTNVTLLVPTVVGTVMAAGTITDVSTDSVHNYTHMGTSGATNQFQVVNMATPTAPTILRSVSTTGNVAVTGVAYSSTKDVTPAAINSTTSEVVIYAPN